MQQTSFIAKALIAYHLGIHEVRPASLAKWAGGHWYELLANHLIGPRLDTFPQRDIMRSSRSTTSARSNSTCLTASPADFSSGTAKPTSGAALLRLPIIHIYGRMGQLPGFAAPASRNEPTSRSVIASRWRRRLPGCTFSASCGMIPRAERDAARQHLRDAKGTVTFLGLAHAHENSGSNLTSPITCIAKRAIYGTIFEMGEDERHKELIGASPSAI